MRPIIPKTPWHLKGDKILDDVGEIVAVIDCVKQHLSTGKLIEQAPELLRICLRLAEKQKLGRIFLHFEDLAHLKRVLSKIKA